MAKGFSHGLRGTVRTLEDHLAAFPPDLLDHICEEKYLLRLSKSIIEWRELSPFLEITPSEENDILTAVPPLTPPRQRIDMLRKWKEKFGDKATYRCLIEALFESDKVDLIDKLCIMLNEKQNTNTSGSQSQTNHPSAVTASAGAVQSSNLSQSIVNPSQIPECVLKYAVYLKGRYKRMSAVPDPKWPPSIGKKITKLALIERDRDFLSEFDSETPKSQSMEYDYIHGKIDNIVARKKEIEFDNVFDQIGDDESLRILMDGAPGVGKTTLARKASIDWASGEFLQQYELVVLVPLREVKNKVEGHIEIKDLFFSDCPKLRQNIIDHVQATSGKGVLFIFDGFDELKDKERKKKSLFLDIIKGDALCQCSVLVTSRPYASTSLQRLQSIVRHVEVLGFTEKQIEACIKQNLPSEDKAADLIQKLKERVDIASLCYIPLNCAIMIYVYRRHHYKLPDTLTDLFDKFILDSLKRRPLTDIRDDCISKIDLQDLPEAVRKQFLSLCNLAYNGLQEDRFIFSGKELKSLFPDCIETADIQASCLDLVTAIMTCTSSGQEMHYQFLHLSIQEYLCAWRISMLPEARQVSFINRHLNNSRFHLVILFIGGITKLSMPSKEKIISRKQLDLSKRKEIKSDFLFIAHLVFESQNFSLYSLLFKCLTNKEIFTLDNYSLSLFDCMVIAHFLCSTDHSWSKLSLRNCSLSKQSLAVFDEVCTSWKDCKTTFNKVILNNNHPSIVTNLHAFPTQWISCTVSFICLCTEPIRDISETPLCIPNISHINNLNISTPIGTHSKAVCKIDPKATKVYLQKISVGDHQVNTRLDQKQVQELSVKDVSIANLTSFAVQALKVTSSKLCVLTLANASVSCDDAISLFKAIEHNKTLQTLDLSGNCSISEGGKMLGESLACMLRANKSILILHLNDGSVSDFILQYIADGFSMNNQLTELDLINNDLNPSSVSLFVSKLFENKPYSLTVTQTTSSELHQQKRIVKFVHPTQRSLMFEFDSEYTMLTNEDDENVGGILKEILCTSTTLVTLKLHLSTLNDCLPKFVSTGITQNQSLKTVHISYFMLLSVQAASEILTSADSNQQLSTLQLTNICLSRVIVQDRMVWTLESKVDTNFLRFCVSLSNSQMKVILEEIKVSHSQLSSTDIISLLSYCAKGTLQLNNLDLSEQVKISHRQYLNTGTEETMSISDLLGVVKLRTLNLSDNPNVGKLDDKETAEAIEKILRVTNSLTKLYLSHSGIEGIVAGGITAGLKENTSLESLGINDNPISVDSMHELFLVANTHSKLTHLQLYSTTISRKDPKSFWFVSDTRSVEFWTMCSMYSDIPVDQVKINKGQCLISSAEGKMSIFDLLTVGDVKISTLDLSNNPNVGKLNDKETAKAIKKMLCVTNSLKKLDLNHCGIGDTVAGGIAAGLRQNTSLESLNISNNPISVSLVNEMFLSVHANTKLLHLQLYWGETHSRSQACPLSCPSPNQYRNYWIVPCSRISQSIDSRMCSLCDLTDGCKSLSLDFSECEMSSDRAIQVLNLLIYSGKSLIIDTLDLSNNPNIGESNNEEISKAVETVLGTTSSLRSLKMRNCGINNSVARGITAGLKENTSLESLNIDDNLVIVDSMRELFLVANTHSKLIHLQLYSTTISRKDPKSSWFVSDTGRVEFWTMCSMYLDIPVDQVKINQGQCLISSAEGKMSIFDLLIVGDVKISTLDLSNNPNVGKLNNKETAEAIKKMLCKTKALTKIDLSHCGIGDTVAGGIAAGFKENTSLHSLNIDDNPVSVDSMRELFVVANTHSKLIHLQLYSTTISRRYPKSSWIVSESRSIRFWTICSTQSNVHVSRLIFQEECVIESAEGTMNIFDSLSTSEVIVSSLDLSNNPNVGKLNDTSTAAAVEKMLHVLKSLTNLDLSGCGIGNTVARGIADGLKGNTSLKSINVCDNLISIDCINEMFLSAYANVNLLHLQLHWGNNHRVLYYNVLNCQSLHHNTNCWIVPCARIDKKRDLGTCSLCKDGCNVNSIDFCRCEMSNDRAIQVLNLLIDYRNSLIIKSLDLSNNPNIGKSNNEEISKAIEIMLGLTASLKSLKMTNCGIDNSIAGGITAGLKQNTSLKSLNIDDNPVSVDSMRELFLVANTHSKLIFLQLYSTTISREDPKSSWFVSDTRSVEFWTMCSKLSNVSIDQVKINEGQCLICSAEGKMSIFDLLIEGDVKLCTLDLSNNPNVGKLNDKETAETIERMLCVINSLKKLDLSHCGIEDIVAGGIAAGLKQNSSLESLNVCDNPISVSCVSEMFMSAYTNTKLLHLQLHWDNTRRPQNLNPWNDSGTDYNPKCWIVPCSREYEKNQVEMCSLCKDGCNVSRPSLDFSQCEMFSYRTVQILNSLCNFRRTLKVESLDLSNNPNIGKSNNEETSKAIEIMLSTTSSLKSLKMTNCGIDNSIAGGITAGLKKNTSLERLIIDDNPVSVDFMHDLFLVANTHNKLICLQLYSTIMSRKDPKCFWLVSDTRSVDFLMMCSTHTNIHINKLRIKKDFMIKSAEGTMNIFGFLSASKVKVSTLDLSDNRTVGKHDDKETAEAIENMLCVTKLLTNLDLSCCGIGDTVAGGIAAGLISNTTLEKLSLYGNPAITVSCMNDLLLSANTQKRIQSLEFNGMKATQIVDCDKWKVSLTCNFWDKLNDIVPNVFILLSNTKVIVHELDVSRLRVNRHTLESDSRCTEVVNQMFAKNTTIRVLNADDVSEEVLMILLKGLHYSCSVQMLSCNNIDFDKSLTEALAEQLQHNSSLTELHVNGLYCARCKRNSDGVKKFGQSLVQNTSLQVITVSVDAKTLLQRYIDAKLTLKKQINFHYTQTYCVTCRLSTPFYSSSLVSSLLRKVALS